MEDEKSTPEEQSELYQALIECSRDLHTLIDKDGVITYQSPSITDVLGWRPQEVVGSRVLSYTHEEDQALLAKEFANVLGAPEQTRRSMSRMRCKDGSYRLLDGVIRNELANPSLRGIVVESRELVSGPELHRALQNSEHLFRTIVSHPEIMIWAIDKRGNITVSEGGGLELMGVEPGVLVGTNVFELYAETPKLVANIRRALKGETLHYSAEMAGPAGKLTMDSRLRPQYSEQGEVTGVTAITFEVSERVKLENKLRRAQTMEAIGMLAGGVAHDFNNLLTAIIGFASVAKRADEGKRDEYLDHVIESATRGATLVRQLLSFASKDEIRPETVDVANLIQSGLPLYQQVVGNSVEIIVDTEEDTSSHIQIDRSKLEQVFLNLVTNARDAMPSGGTLRFRLNQIEDKSGESWVQIDVSDTGQGMDQATQACVFDPFFSTKKQGSGLGLATSHSIVSRADGTLSVASAIGEGAAFQLRFPSFQAPQPTTPTATLAKARVRAASLLLIDDNEAVLSSTALMLEGAGYEVSTAESGQEGYDQFVRSKGQYDLVVSDMTMPGMKGDELAQLLREIDSTTPILCVSGYHEGSDILGTLDGVSLLSKPYQGDELIDAIDKMLRAAQASVDEI